MNGMTIRDLHIGDVVRTKVNVPVSGSRIGRVMELSQNSVYLDEKGYFEPDKLEGISLTEVRLLERFGFRHDETQGCILYGNRAKVFYTMSQTVDSVFIKTPSNEWKRYGCIGYLHELQQAYHKIAGGIMELKV